MITRLAAIMMPALALVYVTAAQAATITECGTSKGYGYYFEGAGIHPGAPGWHEESVRDGAFKLTQDGNQLDLVVTDKEGTKSLKAQGFQVFSIPQRTTGFIQVVAIHQKGVVEHYLFQLDALGNGKVAWGSLKGNYWPVQKSGLYEATCLSPPKQ